MCYLVAYHPETSTWERCLLRRPKVNDMFLATVCTKDGNPIEPSLKADYRVGEGSSSCKLGIVHSSGCKECREILQSVVGTPC